MVMDQISYSVDLVEECNLYPTVPVHEIHFLNTICEWYMHRLIPNKVWFFGGENRLIIETT